MKCHTRSIILGLLCLIIGCSASARAENWVKLGTFKRFILYIDLDSIKWQSKNEAEVWQKTVLTEEGKSYFRLGYEKLGIKDEPPATVMTLEHYSNNTHTSLRQIYLDDHGRTALESDIPLPPSPIEKGSLNETVWEYLSSHRNVLKAFAPPREST